MTHGPFERRRRPDGTDIDERRLGTNPRKRDSDGDGISDKDELMFDEQTRQFNGVDSDDDVSMHGNLRRMTKTWMGCLMLKTLRRMIQIVLRRVHHPQPASCDEGEPCVVGVGACRELGALRAPMTSWARSAWGSQACQRKNYATTRTTTAMARRTKTLPNKSGRR